MSRTNKNLGFTEEEVEEIQEAFTMFDSNGEGTINPKVLKTAMVSLGFDRKSPIVFDMISELERSGNNINFEEFLEGISKQLGHRED
jgi:Ca2+-binding EF-hand superfamily protein